MSIKNNARLRRAKSTRAHIRVLGVPRLSVLRTGQHLYAQLFSAEGSKVIAAANTLQADVKEGLKNGKNSDAAARVGKVIAERAVAVGVLKIAFGRSGYRYDGRIKAVADAAREGGLQFWLEKHGVSPHALNLPVRAVTRAPRLLFVNAVHCNIPQL